MTSPHVLHLIDGLNVGGAEVLLRQLAVGLQQRGWRVSVGYSTPGPVAADLKLLGLKPVQLPRLARVDPTLLARMFFLMLSTRPHIVHTHLFKSDFHGRLAARMAGVPVVVSTLHNADVWARKWPLGPLYGATARLADRLIACSAEVGEYHLRYSKLQAHKIMTIPNGVDVAAFVGRKAAGAQVRASLGIAPGAPVFGIIGRLKPQKDHVTFLAAAAQVLMRRPEARFVIVGDGPLRAELEQQARQLGLFPAVIFTGLRSDIPDLLAAFDVLVFSSRWEGLPVTLLEGMAASLPVVATAVDGINGVAVPDVTAMLVPPVNPAELAHACLQLVADSQKMLRLGRAGFERVSQFYSLEAMIDRTAGVYAELMRARGLEKLLPASVEGQHER